MSSPFEDYWKEKKFFRRQDTTPPTPLNELMAQLGIPVKHLRDDTQMLLVQLPPNLSKEEILQQLPVSPGMLIQAVLDNLQITQSELAQRMGITRTAIHLWVHGQRALTVENAIMLEKYLGIPAYILLRLQADYQLFAARHPDLATDQVPRHSTL